MTNNWLNRVTGQPVVESVKAPSTRSALLRRVVGEAEDEKESKPKEKKEAPDKPEKSEEPKDTAPPKQDAPVKAEAPGEPAPDSGGEEGEANLPIEANHIDSQTVQHLVSAWQSGSQMDVANELMYTPVSYVDFVQMLYRIGEEEGVQLGTLLDQLADARAAMGRPQTGGEDELSATTNTGGADRILSKIAQRRSREMPPAEPAGETSFEQDAIV